MTADESAIHELLATWFAATKAGDVDAVLQLMTDDVLFTVAGREPFGKAAFASASRAAAGMTFGGTADIVELSIHGDWAWMRVRLRVTAAPPGGATITRSGYNLTILRKGAGGKWRIHRDANLLGPPEKP